MNNKSVTIVVSQITVASSHAVAGFNEGEHQPHGYKAEDEHAGQPGREVHGSSPIAPTDRQSRGNATCPRDTGRPTPTSTYSPAAAFQTESTPCTLPGWPCRMHEWGRRCSSSPGVT